MGDKKTNRFITLIQEHERIIHKVIGLYIDNKEDKKDCYQEIMVQSWKAYDRFEGRSRFSTWLYKVCLNTALTFKKRQPKETGPIEEVTHIAEQRPVEKSETLYLIIKQLNEVDKMIITLHLEGYKNPEISEITGMATNNINVKIHRIKNHIIESFKIYNHGHL